MSKWDFYKNINRNGTLVNHFHPNDDRADTTSPNIVMEQLWLQDNAAQVEIIELDSDDSDGEPVKEKDTNISSIWSCLDNDRFSVPQPEFYQANQKAREKRRMQNTNNFETSKPYVNDQSDAPTNTIFSSFYDLTNDLRNQNNSRNYQSSFFTIVNKPFMYSPDSSYSDETEWKDRLNTPDFSNKNEMFYDSEILNYDESMDTTKRTVWIYSFRNKRKLSENDFELVNIRSQDSSSSTSCSLDNFIEEPVKPPNVGRIASPIPATYVPRLNLSMGPTLPIVTEITEPNTSTQIRSPEADRTQSTRLKSVNNWLNSEVVKSPQNEKNKEDKSSSTNVINWMCLSPRERRRRFKHTSASPTYQPVLPVLSEIPSELKSPSSLPAESECHKLQTTAEINTLDQIFDTVPTQTSKRSIVKSESTNDEPIVRNIENDEINDDEVDLNLLKKPKVKITFHRKRNINGAVTDPIEKLHSNNWIHEDNKIKEPIKDADTTESEVTQLNNVTYQIVNEECAGKRLWIRNMPLLKPVEWAEYMPITGSVPSLHLSIESDSGKQPTWLSRLAKCFRCFK